MLATPRRSLRRQAACVVSGFGQRRDLRDREGARSSAAPSSPAPTPRATSSTTTGIDLDLLKQIKEVEREPHQRCTPTRAAGGATFVDRRHPSGTSPCDVALPCATQNELDEAQTRDAGRERRASRVAEGANMPTTPERDPACSSEAGVLFGPGKAANAGGVATSALEMQQNASRDSWSFEHTEERLAEIMARIHDRCRDDRRRVRRARRLRGRREHRRLHQGRRRDARPRRDLSGQRAACSVK